MALTTKGIRFSLTIADCCPNRPQISCVRVRYKKLTCVPSPYIVREGDSNSGIRQKTLFMIPDFILVVGGYSGSGRLDTVEVASPDPIARPLQDCMKNMGNFPQQINGAVGTTFGKLKGKWIMQGSDD